MPTTPDYDKLIRDGLKLLCRLDETILLAAIPLVVLDKGDVVCLANGITLYEFDVVDNGKHHPYSGRMTKAQAGYLNNKDHLDSLKHFGQAVATVAANVYSQVGAALNDLDKAWDAPAVGKVARVAGDIGNGGIPLPLPCCCVVDGVSMNNIPADQCIAVFQGVPSDGPCVKVP